MDLDTVSDDLYGLRPTAFTTSRDARAAEARREGDGELAAAVKKLRRPTLGAWLVNLLARERPDQVAHLVELGSAMRNAQGDLAAADLRRLSAERRTVLGALMSEARDLAAGAGQSVSEAGWRELEATLEAAMVDPDAGKAVRAGRLTTGLSYSGLGPVDLSGAVATPTGKRGDRRTATRGQAGGPEAPGRDQAGSIRAAELAVREAEAAADHRQREADELGSRVRVAREERKQRQQKLRALERQLRELRTAEDRATVAQGGAERDLRGAKERARAANDQVVRARAALKALRR